MSEKDFSYKVVPNSYRKFVTPRHKKNYHKVYNPLRQDLLEGKTLLLDVNIPLGGEFPNVKTLYGFFNARGMRLRMHLFNDIDKGIYRGVLMWAEPIK